MIQNKKYDFDKVFDTTIGQGTPCIAYYRVTYISSTEKVFEEVQPLVVSVLDGYNVCLFAYGQTGSGKTWTMEGVPENRGVNFRALAELFRLAQVRSASFKFDISVSILEIYNENVRDLLCSESGKKYPQM